MNKYLINKTTKFYFTTITREIIIDENLHELVETEEDINPNFYINKWNGINWIEGADQNIIKKIIVPNQLSRMKFKMQVLITTGITYDDIIAFIQGLEMSDFYKKLLLIRLEDCVMFERYSEDLLSISGLMGITDEQLDEIFINGNLID